MTIEELKDEAGRLDPKQRQDLARWLIDSVDPVAPYALDLGAELRRRSDEAAANPQSGISLEDWRANMAARRNK